MEEKAKKLLLCPECDGCGFWYCDERGNEYKRPVKCEDCNGSGFIKEKH